jgi:hypothetical protein
MKNQMFPLALVATTALSSAVGFNPSPAEANPNSSFSCGSAAGVPATIVDHPQHGTVTLIRWVSDYFEASGYDPQTRCDLVSQRFQTYKEQGTLQYLTTGIMNRQNVICVSSRNGGECEGLLFTLKPFSDPTQTLKDLTNLRASAGQAPALSETPDRLYVNFEDFVREKAEVQSEETVPTDSLLF